jgi:hypothetical protein
MTYITLLLTTWTHGTAWKGATSTIPQRGNIVSRNQYQGGRGLMVAVVALTTLAAGSLSGCTTDAADPAEPISATTKANPDSSPGSVPADRTLGDDGIGGLSLGQSRKAALATGLVGPKQKESNPLCEIRTGKGDIQFVYLVKGKVSIIAVGPAIRLDTGIGVGDTYQALHAEYPGAVDAGPGRLSLEAPAAPVKAHYRIGMDAGEQVYPDSKITEIALQADDQSCYE